MTTDRKKFNLKDWFFRAFTRPPSNIKSKRKFFSLPQGEYEKRRGALHRTQPRRFRRGRSWQGGKLVRAERFKLWSK